MYYPTHLNFLLKKNNNTKHKLNLFFKISNTREHVIIVYDLQLITRKKIMVSQSVPKVPSSWPVYKLNVPWWGT